MNFDMEQEGMRNQLMQLNSMMQIVDPKLYSYLRKYTTKKWLANYQIRKTWTLGVHPMLEFVFFSFVTVTEWQTLCGTDQFVILKLVVWHLSEYNNDNKDHFKVLVSVESGFKQLCFCFVCLESKECSNLYFCFRWLLIWFKREFTMDNICRVWEVRTPFLSSRPATE